MKAILSSKSYFILMLPIFFVLHGFVQHMGFIEVRSLWPLLLMLLVAAVLLYAFCRLLLKNPLKAGLLTLFFFGFFLFFGALYDFLKVWSPWKFVWKYSVLLSGFMIVSLLLLFYLRRSKKDFGKTTLFFNLLFLVLIGFDLIQLAVTSSWKKSGAHSIEASKKLTIPSGKSKPDIYLLLFDEYSSTRLLKNAYQFDNIALDSFLVQQGFHINAGSRSNYPETILSMPSCLNMDYLQWLKPGMEINRSHYQRCAEEIRNNEVTRYLSSNGYKIVNKSIFDLKNHPTPVSQRWLNIDTRLITEETLLTRLCYEFNWFFNRYRLLRRLLPVTSYEEQMQNNMYCIQGVLQESKRSDPAPRFIYGHFLMPHFPYFYDRNGQPLSDSLLKGMFENKIQPLPHYLEYVQYANTEIRKLITGIRKNNPQAVVIFLSDHGYRWLVPLERIAEVFPNQNAVFLPSGKYELFYDSISNVNQFRVIFNSLFDAQYPLLKDTSIYIPSGKAPY